MSSTNSTIQQLATDFATMRGDLTTFFGNFTTFSVAVQAFIAAAQSGLTGTTLSAADAATLADLDTQAKGLDSASQTAQATMGAITVPASTTSAT